ncbi:MAG: SLBB domain-containing protein, partial [Deltaproteobacteria bacterium]|nr:SLBB domain-containing protein [Deltaproteobacteria bacterium]
PTVINNVETLSCVPLIIEKGAKWFASIGPEKSPGIKLFGVSGHVKTPGMYELAMGTPLREIIFTHAGGMREGARFKAAIPGGVSAPLLIEGELDTPMDYDSLAAKRSMLGSGGVIVMDETTCMVRIAYIINRFFSHESCGKCTPCREGTTWMTKVLKRLEHGDGRSGDVELIENICSNVFGRTFCPLGDGAVMALRGIMTKFRDEFVYHVEHKKCMAA